MKTSNPYFMTGDPPTIIIVTLDLVADHTDCIKLVLWEEKTDEVQSRKSYHFSNVTLWRFGDDKYVNTNHSTILKKTKNMIEVNLENPLINNNIISGKRIRVNIKKCCM